MNENFGVKGGKRDRKIFLLLKRKKRKEKEAIDKQIQRNDIKLLAIEMAIPKLKGTKSLINTTIMYMYFMKHFITPKLKTKKYKVYLYIFIMAFNFLITFFSILDM